MANDFNLISLDIETSTSDYNTGTILSVAMVDFNTGKMIERNIRHSYVSLTPEAMRVNQIDVLTLDSTERDYVNQAEQHLIWFVDKMTEPDAIILPNAIHKKQPIPLGMNVGTFDMLFVRKYMPDLAKKFGYRSCDLNALFFAEAVVLDKNFTKCKNEFYEKAMNFAAAIRPDLKKHNPLFDCYINCSLLAQITNKVPKWMSPYTVYTITKVG